LDKIDFLVAAWRYAQGTLEDSVQMAFHCRLPKPADQRQHPSQRSVSTAATTANSRGASIYPLVKYST